MSLYRLHRLARVLITASVTALLVASPAVAADKGLIQITAAQARSMGLSVVSAVSASEAPIATMPATVSPPLNGRIAVSSPFAGAVVRVSVLEGQQVKTGQELAVLNSQDMIKAHGELARAQAELNVANAAARRTHTLAGEGVISVARAEEAEARSAQALAMVNEQRRLIGGGGSGRPGEYVLRAPISGRVSQINLQPGGGVEAMAAAIMVDRTDRLWVEARLPAELIGKVRTGYLVEAAGLRGRVVAASGAIDPKTRSAILRAELPAGAKLVPGQTTNITLLAPAVAGAVSLPRASVIRVNGGDVVFVRQPDGYRALPVHVIGSSPDRVVVSGPAPGTQVVAAGVSQLKSAAGR